MYWPEIILQSSGQDSIEVLSRQIVYGGLHWPNVSFVSENTTDDFIFKVNVSVAIVLWGLKKQVGSLASCDLSEKVVAVYNRLLKQYS